MIKTCILIAGVLLIIPAETHAALCGLSSGAWVFLWFVVCFPIISVGFFIYNNLFKDAPKEYLQFSLLSLFVNGCVLFLEVALRAELFLPIVLYIGIPLFSLTSIVGVIKVFVAKYSKLKK